MKISPSLYYTLTPRQRLLAALEAIRRNDEVEIARIKDSCPHRHYRLRDLEFTDSLTKLLDFSLSVELDIASAVCRFTFFDFDAALQTAKVIDAGWLAYLESIGVSKETARAAFAPRDAVVNRILEMAPEPEQEQVQGMKSVIAKMIDGTVSVDEAKTMYDAIYKTG